MFTFFGLGNFFLIPGQYWRHTDDFFLAYTTGSRSQIVPFLLTVFGFFFPDGARYTWVISTFLVTVTCQFAFLEPSLVRPPEQHNYKLLGNYSDRSFLPWCMYFNNMTL